MSSPLDVLRFRPLGLVDRVRLGMLVLKAKGLADWRPLESETAEQWLISRCGRRGYSVVWEPLLRAKFGSFAREVSAVWFWNKLVLRGGSRNSVGNEMLGYVNGSLGAMAEALAVLQANESEIRNEKSSLDRDEMVKNSLDNLLGSC